MLYSADLKPLQQPQLDLRCLVVSIYHSHRSRPRSAFAPSPLLYILHNNTSFITVLKTASNVVNTENRARASRAAVEVHNQHTRVIRVQLSDETLSAKRKMRFPEPGARQGKEHALHNQFLDGGLELGDAALRVQTFACVDIRARSASTEGETMTENGGVPTMR